MFLICVRMIYKRGWRLHVGYVQHITHVKLQNLSIFSKIYDWTYMYQLGIMYLNWTYNFQILRDEEGKKFGLKSKEKTSVSDSEVKMVDVEVRSSPNTRKSCVFCFSRVQSTSFMMCLCCNRWKLSYVDKCFCVYRNHLMVGVALPKMLLRKVISIIKKKW